MISVIQLVSSASVSVNATTIGEIGKGIVALVGFEKKDDLNSAIKLMEKILNYRIFPDEKGKTNRSIRDVRGGLLLVPQFTLVADTMHGLRPGFSVGMPCEEGKRLFSRLVDHTQAIYETVACGEFGANMSISLCNEGPMTFILHN